MKAQHQLGTNSDDRRDRIYIVLWWAALVSAAAAVFVSVVSFAGTLGFLSSSSPEAVAAAIFQILISVVTFTTPVVTFWVSRSVPALVAAIVLNILIVLVTILVGMPASDLAADIVFRTFQLSVPFARP